MRERFTIELSTDQRPTRHSPVTVKRETFLRDGDENEYDIPIQGPTKVDVDGNGKATFALYFDGRPSLVEGRSWPIPFKLKNSRGHTLARAKAYVACMQDESE